MLQECRMSDYQRKVSMDNCRKETALKAAKRNATKTPLKLLKDFNIPTEPWEQAAQDRTKWRNLINKGAAQ